MTLLKKVKLLELICGDIDSTLKQTIQIKIKRQMIILKIPLMMMTKTQNPLMNLKKVVGSNVL